MKVIDYIYENKEKKGIFAVIDPLDYKSFDEMLKTAKNCNEAGVKAILIGGSTGVQGEFLDNVVKEIKSLSSVPIILFPGNIGTVSKYADAIYFMSMLNSRSTYWHSYAQALAAPVIKQYKIEPLPTGYIVVEPGGTVGWVGDANLIPRNKPKLAAALALAGQYIGNKIIITDAGSNPYSHIPLEMINYVSKSIEIPYIVAGGVRKPDEVKNVIKAGADFIQIGTAFEKSNQIEKIKKLVNAVKI